MKLSKALSAALAAAGMGYAIGNLNPALSWVCAEATTYAKRAPATRERQIL